MMRRQRGVAVVTALLLTTLAVAIVASLFWQQQVQVRSMENQRLQLQTRWIERGALDWARLVLLQDGYDNQIHTTLNDVWNTPLAETRLDQYIERERSANETFDATLSGKISDASARYNLRNLAEKRQIDSEQVDIFRRLLNNLHLDQGLADRVALAVARSQEAPPAAAAAASGGQGGASNPSAPQPVAQSKSSEPMAVTRLEDLLGVEGFDQQVLVRLRDFAIVLPDVNKVNVNTAPAEVLAAVANVPLGEGNALVGRRKTAPWRSVADFTSVLSHAPAQPQFDVVSEYFLVNSRVKLDRAALNTEALVNRKLKPLISSTLVWVRQE